MALTYKDAGVDIEAGDAFVDAIRPHADRTRRPEVMDSLGGFGGLFALPPGRWREPVLVSGTDGVGTKLQIAHATGIHRPVGVDLVAMCVNDIVVTGAEPLFFLDYYASGRLDPAVAVEVVAGIADGCEQSGCALIGGETAEMPGSYPPGEYDLAGFAVGVVERSAILDRAKVQPGDVVIGLASSGLHSNGFSLARKLFSTYEGGWDARPEALGGQRLAEAAMAPTTLYVKGLLALARAEILRSAAHITGGGIPGNLPRSLPPGLMAQIDLGAWTRPPIFELLLASEVPTPELFRTFNMGLGMICVVPAEERDTALACLREAGHGAFEIGVITPREGDEGVAFSGEVPR